MAQIHIRDLDEKVVRRLKARARQGGRSLQSETKAILERAASQPTPAEQLRNLRRVRKLFAGRTFSDSAELIREDRDNR